MKETFPLNGLAIFVISVLFELSSGLIGGLIGGKGGIIGLLSSYRLIVLSPFGLQSKFSQTALNPSTFNKI